MLQKLGEIQLVDDADAAIAATGQPNGFNILIVKILLEYSGAKIIVAGKDIMLHKESIVIDGDKTFLFQPVDGELHLFWRHHPRWCSDRYY